MTDLRTRIAAVLRSELLEINYSSAEESADGEQWVFIDGAVMPDALADAVIAELGLSRIVGYCEQQTAVGWRDVGTADDALGRNIVAESVLVILEGGQK